MKKDTTKLTNTLNAVFAYWVAISTMGQRADQLKDWATTGAGVAITGRRIDQATIKHLFEKFPKGEGSFAQVLGAAGKFADIDTWDPHDESIAVLNAISKLKVF